MKKKRVLSIFGTRPEAIKMAPVVMELQRSEYIDSRVCITAQHREMLDQVLKIFQIIPDVDLNLMVPDQSLAEISSAIFNNLDAVLTDIKPDWILVQGDTTTVMTASILGYYHRIKVGHIEAGLRSGDKWQPFPEEINRKIASAVADFHFAPTEWSRQNLLREGIAENIIQVTGNPVIDALHYVANKPLPEEASDIFNQIGMPVERKESEPRLILVTAHRRENFGQPLENICKALRGLAEKYGETLRIVYTVHLNPNVQEPVYRNLEGLPNITLLPPLDYQPLVHIMKRAYIVLTDSGGLQEEAPDMGIPVLVLRAVTERPEGVEAGTVKVVGTNSEKIIKETSILLDDQASYTKMARAVNPYGDGHAAERIVKTLLEV